MPATSSPEAHLMTKYAHHLQLNCQDQTSCGLADTHCSQFQSACPVAQVAYSSQLPRFKNSSTPYNRNPLPGFNKRAKHPPKAS
ncbi:hypothetical protein QWZ13_07120 [Reinekea marina]|nr:hypothetical protein [Reinekea marina]MDN3648683.1 hypothetical protein [Reinekea marina]